MQLKSVLLKALLVSTIMGVQVAYSHDIWLLPERFNLSKGDQLTVHQMAGTELDTELDLQLLLDMTTRFDFISKDASVDLLSAFRKLKTSVAPKPVLERKLVSEGLVLLTMEHEFVYDEFSTQKFIQYLNHEEYNVEKLPENFESKSTQSERYARSLKTLVQVDKDSAGDLYKRIMGQNIEIVLLQNPYVLAHGHQLDIQVFFKNQPLKDQLVMAFNRDGKQPVRKFKSRTNAHGIAHFTLDNRGTWLIRLVHLLPCSRSSDIECSDIDWESYWASFSFGFD